MKMKHSRQPFSELNSPWIDFSTQTANCTSALFWSTWKIITWVSCYFPTMVRYSLYFIYSYIAQVWCCCHVGMVYYWRQCSIVVGFLVCVTTLTFWWFLFWSVAKARCTVDSLFFLAGIHVMMTFDLHKGSIIQHVQRVAAAKHSSVKATPSKDTGEWNERLSGCPGSLAVQVLWLCVCGVGRGVCVFTYWEAWVIFISHCAEYVSVYS
jgi:hypothetical protein